MKYKLYIFLGITLWMGLSFASCSGEDEVVTGSDKGVEIAFISDGFTKITVTPKSATSTISPFTTTFSNPPPTTRATDTGSIEENQIDDLYLFLFKSDGTDPVKYYIGTPGTFTHNGKSGNWDKTNGRITLNMTQAEAGTRQVFIVANCVNLKTALDNVTTITGNGMTALENVLCTTATPWTPTLSTPILMSGNVTHNFIDNRILGTGGSNPKIKLVRALAKVELNIRLTQEHQSIPVVKEGDINDPNATLTERPQYHYAFLNFDKNSYAVRPAPTKQSDLTAPNATVDLRSLGESDWTVWPIPETSGNSIVTDLQLVTYINERDKEADRPLSSIGISVPYTGPTPPPEFGPDISQIFLPEKIERNHWYVYDVEL
ncbi:fimbrial protein [Proteiniphilum sp. UBA5384]|uniref:fimbrial protein n=1 Tax=Proteiniphilum sp. UBA5384 TaxID=1947279 RepID=UPI0025D1080E|nr:fimbrial protein [Proteiniphilum sp. UBA5384]